MRFQEENILQNSRITAWQEVFLGMLDHPLGGEQASISLKYAHNLWLDVGYYAGVFPFVLIVISTIIALVSVISFTRSKHPLLLKQLFIALFAAFFITFMMEPIMQGAFTYFTMFCFCVGILQRLNADYHKD